MHSRGLPEPAVLNLRGGEVSKPLSEVPLAEDETLMEGFEATLSGVPVKVTVSSLLPNDQKADNSLATVDQLLAVKVMTTSASWHCQTEVRSLYAQSFNHQSRYRLC